MSAEARNCATCAHSCPIGVPKPPKLTMTVTQRYGFLRPKTREVEVCIDRFGWAERAYETALWWAENCVNCTLEPTWVKVRKGHFCSHFELKTEGTKTDD